MSVYCFFVGAVVGQLFALPTSTYFAISGTGNTGNVYSATGLKGGLSINANTGIISGVPQQEDFMEGVVVTLADRFSNTATSNAFTIVVQSVSCASRFENKLIFAPFAFAPSWPSPFET